ncbi:hypothetical protein JMA_31960 [Jeotgalibacillus malaysiensis]|uniref:Uncharacterized protein n=1 Tax=Jeotgalibacillus malaysiensis TaxID=1508404 RepID=A0A0B5AV88_9BACL|nr:hypothetical protein JMA_31960 [Jeotgalibacillus malaysiensis]
MKSYEIVFTIKSYNIMKSISIPNKKILNIFFILKNNDN